MPNFNMGVWRNERDCPVHLQGSPSGDRAADTRRLIAYYWQIKIDGVLQSELLFSSLRVAANRAKKLIDQERSAN
jgi:hypothetical protein